MKINVYILAMTAVLFWSCGGEGKTEEGVSDEPAISGEDVEFETNDEGSAVTAYPVITFDNETIDLGEMVDGEKKVFKFYFTNTGDADLIIKSARGSCGCTVPAPPKDPIKPGEKSAIDVEFDSNGRGPGEGATEGIENIKDITVWTNCQEPQQIIKFRAFVLPK